MAVKRRTKRRKKNIIHKECFEAPVLQKKTFGIEATIAHCQIEAGRKVLRAKGHDNYCVVLLNYKDFTYLNPVS